MKSFWFGRHIADLADMCIEVDECVKEWSRQAVLCIGSVKYINGIEKLSGNEIFLLINIPKFNVQEPVNTVVLSFSSLEKVEYTLVCLDGRELKKGSLLFKDVFKEMKVSDAIYNIMNESEIDIERRTIDDLIPLFYISSEIIKGSDFELAKSIYIYSQIRFRIEDCLFIRTNTEAYTYLEILNEKMAAKLQMENNKPYAWLHEAVKLHTENAVFLNNHQCYYKKCFEGNELENKFTLECPVDIWSLTIDVYSRLRAGKLEGYIMEYRDEFQQWDYLNNIYEISFPVEEQGYISFIPSTDGKFIVKRKIYNKDQFMRREIQYKSLINIPFNQFIKEKYGLECHKLPTFRRVRYDVNFESVMSGHVYGIFFDYCSVVGSENIVLCQCEIEYLRSRTVINPDEKLVICELDTITTWVREFLRDKKILFNEGYYSKLSFLKDNFER